MRYVVLVLVWGCGFSPLATMGAEDDQQPPPLDDASSQHDGSIVMDARADAQVFLDAPVAEFDPALCPAGYAVNNVTVEPSSRYRLIAAGRTLKVHDADCDDDHPGWTHLVTLESNTEGQQIRDHMTNKTFYVGAVQLRNQAQTNASWFLVTGDPMPATWQTGQPNDNGGSENNEQNFAAADSANDGRLNDVSGSYSYYAVCECDGKPVPAEMANAIADSAP
jgi:Lectin C-type domain